MKLSLFAIVKGDGSLRYRHSGHGSGPMVFDDVGKAKRWARHEGDTVVEIDVDLRRTPLFIRGQKVVGE